MSDTPRAVRITRTGGPDVLEIGESQLPPPGPREVRIDVAFAGVNFIDVYHRGGLYPVDLPFTPGVEGAGVVRAVGAAVDDLSVGDRVGWCMHPGGYAASVNVPAERVVRIPDGLELDAAAAALLQGATAHYLACSTFPLGPEHVAVVHAAAGGTGALLTQIARLRGARVIGTVSTDAKAEVARAAGCDVVVVRARDDLAEVVQRETEGRGADVVYDSIGRDTFDASLACVRRRGTLVSFGQSSGAVAPIDVLALSPSSRYLTRPTLADYLAAPGEFASRTRDLFGWIAAGDLMLRIDRVLPLADAADAHRLLEAGATAGKLLLRP